MVEKNMRKTGKQIFLLAFVAMLIIGLTSWRTTAEPVSEKYIFLESASATICFAIENEKPDSLLLAMDYLGIPKIIQINVFNSSGQKQPIKNLGQEGPVAPTKPEKLYTLKPQEKVMFAYDLRTAYDLKAGSYKIDVISNNKKLFSQSIEIVKRTQLNKETVSGGVAFPIELNNLADAPIPLSCIVGISKTELKGTETHFITVEDVKLANKPFISNLLCFKLPRKASIEKCCLDYKWNLWMLLKSDEEQAIFVWNLLTCEVSNPIKWTKESVEMGSTIAMEGLSDAKIVIAGIKGKEKITLP